MTIHFIHIRKLAAILFGVLAISIMAFYASAVAARPFYTNSGNPIIKYAECGNPIQFIESSDQTSFSVIVSQVPYVIKSLTVFSTNLNKITCFTAEALSTTRYLCHAFYVVVNIHAP